MKMISNLYNRYKELVNYIIFGVGTTVVNWCSYAVLAKLFATVVTDEKMVALWSNIIAWLLATIFAFITNKIWVFDSRSWKLTIWFPEMLKFYSSRIATGLIEIFGVPFLMGLGLNQKIFGITGMVAKVIASVLVVILNYFLSKFLIFCKKKPDEVEEYQVEE